MQTAPEAAALDVPEDAEPRRCPYCEFPFQTEEQRTLHLGVAHEGELTEAERERYEEVFDDETHDLFTLHVKLTVGILLLFFTMSYVYIFVWL